jgi:phosphatidate cytidylyltransferase
VNNFLNRVLTALVAGLIFFGAFFIGRDAFSIFLLIILFLILVCEWPRFCKNNKWLWMLTPFYPVLPVLCLIYLNHYYHSDPLIPLYPFLVAWLADTGGYLTGSMWGKHKLCPNISPKKSWEGLVGSFLGVFLLNLFLCGCSRSLIINRSPVSRLIIVLMIFFSAIITLIALAGDLFESYLKRKADLKDSGVLLPGHGGLLDRFDAVFFVVLVIVLLVP